MWAMAALFGEGWDWNIEICEIASGNPGDRYLTPDRVKVVQPNAELKK